MENKRENNKLSKWWIPSWQTIKCHCLRKKKLWLAGCSPIPTTIQIKLFCQIYFLDQFNLNSQMIDSTQLSWIIEIMGKWKSRIFTPSPLSFTQLVMNHSSGLCEHQVQGFKNIISWGWELVFQILLIQDSWHGFSMNTLNSLKKKFLTVLI